VQILCLTTGGEVASKGNLPDACDLRAAGNAGPLNARSRVAV